MFKSAIEYLVSLKPNQLHQIHGDTYTEKQIIRVAPHVDRPESISVNGLDSIVKLVRNELDMLDNLPLFIRVINHRKVDVFSTLDEYLGRDRLYTAVCDAPEWMPGWRDQEKAIIELRSMFLPTDGSEYMMELLSTISKEDGISSEDNGVSQSVTARTGVALKQTMAVKPRVKLCPFRTFSEVPQPESEFILRLDNNARVGIIEADGEVWKMEAKENISNYLAEKLSEEIAAGQVVIMM